MCNIGRYQIDYILVKQRFGNHVKECKSYSGADIDSEHNLVIMKCSLKFKTTKKVTRTDKFNTAKLQDKETRKHNIPKAAEEALGKETRVARKPWINE